MQIRREEVGHTPGLPIAKRSFTGEIVEVPVQMTWDSAAILTGAAGVVFSAGGVYFAFRDLKKNVLTKVDLLGLQNHNDARYVSKEVCNERHAEK